MNECLKHFKVKTDKICSNCDKLDKCINKMKKILDRKLDKTMVKMIKKLEPNYFGEIKGDIKCQ